MNLIVRMTEPQLSGLAEQISFKLGYLRGDLEELSINTWMYSQHLERIRKLEAIQVSLIDFNSFVYWGEWNPPPHRKGYPTPQRPYVEVSFTDQEVSTLRRERLDASERIGDEAGDDQNPPRTVSPVEDGNLEGGE